MNRRYIKLFAIIGTVALASFVVSRVYGNNGLGVFSGPKFKTDFTLFTTQTDSRITCTGNSPFTIHMAFTNNNANPQTIHVVFTDGDSVNYFLPSHTSLSITQASGGATEGLTDSTITIQLSPPLAKSDVNPVVGWVSVWGDSQDAALACNTFA